MPDLICAGPDRDGGAQREEMDTEQNTVRDRMKLSMQMLVDEMDELLWNDRFFQNGDSPRFSGVQIFNGQTDLRPDQIYVLQRAPEMTGRFPSDDFAYLSVVPVEGKAPHIEIPDKDVFDVLNFALRIFQKYHDWVAQLNSVVNGGGDLNDLCRIGCAFFQNPLYVHDNVFTVIAMPVYVKGMLEFDYDEETGKYFIPLRLIEEFKLNGSYIETLKKRQASIWDVDQYPYGWRSLYVNLWEGEFYRGRLLINEINAPLKPGQFHAAELFAEYVKMILNRDAMDTHRNYQMFEDAIKGYMSGVKTTHIDLGIQLVALGWRETDSYLCVKLQNQQQVGFTGGNALRSAIANLIKASCSFFSDGRLCVFINLTKYGQSETECRSQLAPLIRDSFMYGGTSNPLSSVYQLKNGFHQADIALEYAFRKHDSRWLVAFSGCALDYILGQASRELPAEMVVAPELLALRKIDRQKGSQYYKTLGIYLELERSIPEVSKALIIHRTTLLYRLEKIRELVRLNLEDSMVRAYLLLSYRILEQSPQSGMQEQ